MITEETIERTRFFHNVDGQDYMVTDIRTVKIVTLIKCEDGESVDMILGDDICGQFAPVSAKFVPINVESGLLSGIKGGTQPAGELKSQISDLKSQRSDPGPAPKRKTAKKKTAKKAAGKGRKKGRLPSRPKKSKYKGVTVLQPTRDGAARFGASKWDGKKGKAIHLGTFETELEAAAVYAEHVGDKAEAARLRALAIAEDRAMAGHAASIKATQKTLSAADSQLAAKRQKANDAEQAENNPDQPERKRNFTPSTPGTRGKNNNTTATSAVKKVQCSKGKGKKKIWRCKNKGCGLEWRSKTSMCPICHGEIEVIEE